MPNRSNAPIILLGFARSGTTTFQERLARELKYNAAFEPVAFNHSGYPANQFREIYRLFRIAPEIQQLADYKVSNTTLAALHLLGPCKESEDYISLLKQYFLHLLHFYGHNVVIKELRLLYNLPTLIEILSNLTNPPLFVFLKANPLMTLYTYYRLGGLIENQDDFDLRVDELHAYRIATGSGFEFLLDLVQIRCLNKWEKLLTSVFLEHRMMDYLSATYPDHSVIANFETFDNSISAVAGRLDISIDKKRDAFVLHTPRYMGDRCFQRRLKQMIRPEILEVNSIAIEEPWRKNTSHKRQLQYWITHLQHYILDI